MALDHFRTEHAMTRWSLVTRAASSPVTSNLLNHRWNDAVTRMTVFFSF